MKTTQTLHLALSAAVVLTSMIISPKVKAQQARPTVKSFTDKITAAAWKNKPVYAVKPSNDETIDMGLEDTMYKRANAKVTNVRGGHTLFMTSPKEVAAVIEQAAKGEK